MDVNVVEQIIDQYNQVLDNVLVQYVYHFHMLHQMYVDMLNIRMQDELPNIENYLHVQQHLELIQIYLNIFQIIYLIN